MGTMCVRCMCAVVTTTRICRRRGTLFTPIFYIILCFVCSSATYYVRTYPRVECEWLRRKKSRKREISIHKSSRNNKKKAPYIIPHHLIESLVSSKRQRQVFVEKFWYKEQKQARILSFLGKENQINKN